MNELVIDSAFEGLIPPLTDEEDAQLEANLLAEGCRDALAVWSPEGAEGPPAVLDGYHHYRLCLRHGLPFSTVPICEAVAPPYRLSYGGLAMGRAKHHARLRRLTPAAKARSQRRRR
jgi:hypothetical protein